MGTKGECGNGEGLPSASLKDPRGVMPDAGWLSSSVSMAVLSLTGRADAKDRSVRVVSVMAANCIVAMIRGAEWMRELHGDRSIEGGSEEPYTLSAGCLRHKRDGG